MKKNKKIMNLEQASKEKDISNEIIHSKCSSLDHEWGVIFDIYDIFGFAKFNNNNEPIPLDQHITKDLLEKHYNEILEKLFSQNEYHEHLNHMVLGALIIRERAKMPQELKERILHAISWDAELKWRWKWIDKEKQKDFLEERKNLIESFKQVILNYSSGKT